LTLALITHTHTHARTHGHTHTQLWAGRLRPDFLSRCQYNAEQGKCTGDPQVIWEGRRSFPSGHSSNSFAGLGFLSLWLALALGVRHRASQDKWITSGGIAWKWVVVVLPLLGASYIAISR
jgi:diacylglycerol diphosphate phosphatase/phosphatidate phosphatase